MCGQVGASTPSSPLPCACVRARERPSLQPRARSSRARAGRRSVSEPRTRRSSCRRRRCRHPPSPRAATPDRRLCSPLSRLRPFPPFAPPAAGAWLRHGVAKMEVPRLDHALSSPSSPCEEIKNLSLEAIQLCDRDGEAR